LHQLPVTNYQLPITSYQLLFTNYNTMVDLSIKVNGEALTLMPERAAFWPAQRTLFVADVHVGKAAAFRSLSVAVPDGNLADDLARLSRAIERTDAQDVILLGDVLHAKHGRAEHVMQQVATWREMHSHRHFVMVRGNHDLRAGDPPDDWRMECVDAPAMLAPFVLCHEPCESNAGTVLCGHLHPAFRLAGRGGMRATLPCFVVGEQRIILPAFGSFTGNALVRPAAGERIAVIADDEVISIG
jgi:DNA ligase-associated metallophosphoesterase